MISKNLFNKVVYKGMMGALFGIVGGLILGILIFGFSIITDYAYHYLFSSAYYGSVPPAGIFVMLGTGFGAIIGSIFGCLTAYKENK